MSKDTHTTDIVFRKDTTPNFKGTIFALFPHECSDFRGNVTCYHHIGQHSAADYKYCIRTSVPANPEEYKNLKAELESIGYNIRVVKRQNYDKFLKSHKRLSR